MRSKRQKGVLTVEAAIVLPVFIMVMSFLISILNLFYFHLLMQQALLNTGRTLAQYGYVIEEVLGIADCDLEVFALQKKTKDTEAELETLVNRVLETGGNFVNAMGGKDGTSFVKNIGTVLETGEKFKNSLEKLAEKLKELGADEGTKKMIINYLIVSVMNVADSSFVEWMVGDYMESMHAVNRALDQDKDGKWDSGAIQYALYVEEGTKDIILVAVYDYELPIDLLPSIKLKQMVRVHPWVGGATEGIN